GFVVQPHVSLMEEKGLGKVLLWVSDRMDYQIAAIVYGERMLKERDIGSAFMRAYRKSTDYYYKRGLLAMKENRTSEADEVLGIIAKYTEVGKELVAKGLNYNDPEGRLDLKDIQRQLEWLSKEGLLKKRLTPAEVVDDSFLNQILKN
ncbi:MAG: ABC transporter substrate-binding protein, partial [Desulfatiglandales bacterium]